MLAELANAYACFSRRAGFRLGVALLGLAFCLSASGVFLGTFTDESEKLAAGAWLANGATLYRDIFSHHMPFTYYWVAGVFGLLGHSILAARLSIVFLSVVTFAVLMPLTRAYLPLSAAALGWAAISHLHSGQMVLYQVFSALSLAVLMGLALAQFFGRLRHRRAAALVIGLYSVIAVLSDLSAALPVAGLFVVHLVAWRSQRRPLWLAAAVLAGGLLLVAAVLLLTGTSEDFYRDVLIFNTTVYSKYTPTDLGSWLSATFVQMVTALELFNRPGWMGITGLGPLARFPPFLAWLFVGYLHRVGLLAAGVALLARRQWLAAAALYALASFTLARADGWFRLLPFVLVSLVSVALVADDWMRRPPTVPAHAEGARRRVRGIVWLGAALTFYGLVLWPIVVGAASLAAYGQRQQLSYAANFGPAQRRATEIRLLAGTEATRLGYYPGDPLIYYFSGLRPISRYLYLWPWVAEVALDEIVAQLEDQAAVVYLDHGARVWIHPVADYGRPLQDYLDAHLVLIAPDLYVSPELAAPAAAGP